MINQTISTTLNHLVYLYAFLSLFITWFLPFPLQLIYRIQDHEMEEREIEKKINWHKDNEQDK